MGKSVFFFEKILIYFHELKNINLFIFGLLWEHIKANKMLKIEFYTNGINIMCSKRLKNAIYSKIIKKKWFFFSNFDRQHKDNCCNCVVGTNFSSCTQYGRGQLKWKSLVWWFDHYIWPYITDTYLYRCKRKWKLFYWFEK